MRILPAILALSLSGCATYKNFSPNIAEPARSTLIVNPPVIVSIFDGRGNREGKQAPAESIKAGIAAAYPGSVQFSEYFSPTPSGRVRVRIRVQELGSQFGSRIVSGVAVANQFGTATAMATGGWNTVVAQAQSQQTAFGSAMSAEGWWVGTAAIDMEVQDRRNGKNISFSIPLVAEHRESNMWGYASAKAATKRAWEKVSSRMFSTMDSVLMKTRDTQ